VPGTTANRHVRPAIIGGVSSVAVQMGLARMSHGWWAMFPLAIHKQGILLIYVMEGIMAGWRRVCSLPEMKSDEIWSLGNQK
jgi:hypothetical protein